MTDNRATGWKIPLLFCGVILSIVAVAALFRHTLPNRPPSQALLKEAKGIRIDLESDPEGQSWKARIASAASGFSTQADKDGRLGEIVLTTAENKRFDASCTAAVLIRDDGLRDGLMRKIANAASADCASLPWGVFAMHGMRDPQAQAEASALLTQRWKECHEGRE
ncbi:MAG: GTP cyclohydrolase [Bilophila wadsworthia]